MKTVEELIESIENATIVIRNLFPHKLAVVSLSQEELDDVLHYLREYERLTRSSNWLYDEPISI